MVIMSLNVLKIFYLSISVSVALSSYLIVFFERFLPKSFAQFCLYGRLVPRIDGAFMNKIKVPKRLCFEHMYAFAGPFSTFFLILLYGRCYSFFHFPDAILGLLNYFLADSTKASIPLENVLLASMIFTVHVWKRYYESHYISVFSDVYMNAVMYLISIFYYFGATISIVGEGRNVRTDSPVDLNWERLASLEYTCLAMCLLSDYLQLRTNFILSKLRKDKNGVVVTKRYEIPRGELFELVTAPLQLTEITFYIFLSIILRNGSTFHYVTFFVIVNQMIYAYLSHDWHLKKFKDYSRSKKIIIPYVL